MPPLPGGSKRNHIGAGVWMPSAPPGHQRIHVDPRGEGATNEINRAEAAGVWAALSKKQRMIATDSATVLSQIHKGLLSPMDLRNHKHREMIGHIIAEIQDILNDPNVGPDENIYLCKVKAHNSLIGNEVVDGIAKDAANRKHRIDVTCPTPSTPSYSANFWPHHKRILEDGKPRVESFVNLGNALHSHMHKTHRMGWGIATRTASTTDPGRLLKIKSTLASPCNSPRAPLYSLGLAVLASCIVTAQSGTTRLPSDAVCAPTRPARFALVRTASATLQEAANIRR